MAYTASMEAPDTFHFWTAVSTIAGALRRKVWFDQGHFKWLPNFYVIFVAPPGIVSKSTTMSVGMNILRDVPDVKFGPDAITWQALTMAMAGARLDVLIDGAYLPMSAITIAASEFGTFFNPRDADMVNVLVDLWDGRTGSWEKLTKMSGNDIIVNPWINIIACTTPAWIAGNFPDYMIGGGFTSRCVFVYAEKKRRLIAYPFLEASISDLVEQKAALLSDLCDIAEMAGAFTIEPEAITLGQQWYADHYENAKQALNTPEFAGYLARKQTMVHKLAMVLSAAESSSRRIGQATLDAAIKIITSLEADMPKVFSKIGLEGAAKFTNVVLDIIKGYGKIEKVQLFRFCSGKMGVQEFTAAVEACVAAGFIKVYANGKGITYVYEPNPATDESPRPQADAQRTDS